MQKVLEAISLLVIIAVGPRTAADNLDKTMANVRSLAAVMEAYAMDHGHYPKVSTYEELETLVEPRYIKINEAIVDDWSNSFLYLVTSDGCHYRIVSAGADGRFEDSSVEMSSRLPDQQVAASVQHDIIWQDHAFRQVPPGHRSALDVRQTRRFSCP